MSKGARVGIVVAVVAALALVVFLRERQAGDARGPDAAARVSDPAESGGALPKLLDLGSTTCVPCKMMAPILEELKAEYQGRMVVEVIDVKLERELALRHGIRVIPTQIFFDRDGRELFRHEGFMAKEAILGKWKELGIDLAAGPARG